MAKPETKPEIKRADLPLISVLAKGPMQQAKEVFLELQLHTYCIDPDGNLIKREERIKQLKSELAEIQSTSKLPGLRYGEYCHTSRENPGRKTLDPGLLLENGVTSKQIAASIKQGEPYTVNTFARVTESEE